MKILMRKLRVCAIAHIYKDGGKFIMKNCHAKKKRKKICAKEKKVDGKLAPAPENLKRYALEFEKMILLI